MGKFLKSILSVALVMALLSACNSTGCIDNGSSLPLAGFYSSATKAKVTIASLTVGGVGAANDSLLINNSSASQVYMPFRASTSSVKYFFHYNQEGIDDYAHNDTIRFDYESIPYFASEECGAMFRYRITNVEHTSKFIESVEIVEPLVTNIEEERIHIYFITSESDDE